MVTCRSDYRKGLDWKLDLLNSYNSQLQVRIMLPPLYILYSPMKHTLSLFSLLCLHQCPVLTSLLAAPKLNWLSTAELKRRLSSALNNLDNSPTTTSQSQSHVTTDGQSVCLDVESILVLMTGCLLLFDGYWRVFVGRPPWREVGSVVCQSEPAIFSRLSVYT
jgi:hypothetical protein